MTLPGELERRVRHHFEELDAAGLRRYLRPPTGIDLSSNDYLGLSTHPLLKERMAEAVMREGCGSTGSRLLRGERTTFSAVERRFAAFKGTQAALYFGSGYAANIGVLTTFLEPGDVVFSDEFNHASLIDGLRLAQARRVVYPHCNVAALRQRLEAEREGGQKFLVTESLFSMDGDQAPLREYAALCRATRTALIVDEAHAVGIYGSRGSGLIEATAVDENVFLSINPAGKALGVGGAFVAGPTWAVDFLIQRARPFIFSTAPPPAMAAALDAALTVIADEPERRVNLMSRVGLLRRLLTENSVPLPAACSQILPVILGDNARAVAVAAALQADGFDVRAIRPPTVPQGAARLRIAVNVNLEEAELRRFALALAAALAAAESTEDLSWPG
ncbi:MAG: 8-amino-7-oxononanoate synthase [Acidobacteria bacterium]|nr:8-amino-7-oxononanoate synthase [Acidobacteriota bacterium]